MVDVIIPFFSIMGIGVIDTGIGSCRADAGIGSSLRTLFFFRYRDLWHRQVEIWKQIKS